jgi:hypothetical protein
MIVCNICGTPSWIFNDCFDMERLIDGGGQHVRSVPKLLDRLKRQYEVKTTKEQRVRGTLFGFQHFGGRRACWSSGMGLGRMTNTYSFTRTYTKPNNKLVSA